MKPFCILLFVIITGSSFAQTQLIAFKSHSGNKDNFSVALKEPLFNEEGANFGNPPYKTLFVLDSVIYLSPTAVVFVKRTYHYPWGQTKKDTMEFIALNRDTIQHDLLFANKHALDSIKRVMNTGYYKEMYQTKKTVFAGYDNKKIKAKKKETTDTNNLKENNISPVVIITANNDNDTNYFDGAMIKTIAGIFLLALLGAWLSTKWYALRLQKAA